MFLMEQYTMKPIHLVLILIVVYTSHAIKNNTNHESTEEVTEKETQLFPDNWLEVTLDHFNLFDNRTWKMRYFVNNKFFQKGNPLFIEVGGEWTINGYSLLSGQLHSLAKQHHGMLIETEHRYYGKSLPFSINFTTENLKYLQIEQALEDLAYFIENFKASTPGLENSKVILHGCSYPGMLVTWMRLRFPHIVDISYASSAPLGVGLDYPEYFEVVHDVYANVSSSCISTIREGFNKTAELMKTFEGRAIVKKALKKWDCGDIDEMNSAQILYLMMDILNVQNDPLKYEDVSCLVLSMDADDTSAFHRLANLIVLKSKDMASCSSEDDRSEDSERNTLAWSYQTCTEMGTFQTLNRANSRHPFALDSTVEESVEECVNDFGGIVTEKVLRSGIKRVTRRYGGKKPKVTKVVTVQGTHDPWKHLSVLEDYNSEAPVLVVEGSHCIDIYESYDDPEDLIQVRKKVRNIITRWIRQIS